MEDSNIDYLSGEVKEILGRSPSWVSKWALWGILGILIVLIVTGSIFTYSEIVQGEFVLTTQEPPVPVQAPKTGYLDRLLVKEGAVVQAGEILAVVRSDADLDDVQLLSDELELLGSLDLTAMRSYQPDRNLQLGDLASDYENFLSAFETLPLGGSAQIDQSAIVAIRQHNIQLERSIQSLQNANEAIRKEIAALEIDFRNANELLSKSPKDNNSREVFKINSQLSEKRALISGNEVEISRNREMIRSNNARILEIELQSATGMETKVFQLKQSLTNLKNAVRRWRSQHLITAPANGEVSFYAELAPNQIFTKDDALMAIIPTTEGDKPNFIGHVRIPIEGSGRVRDSQEVNVKFYRYPFREFGVVKGRVAKIYQLPQGDAYSVEIMFEDGLKTSAGQTLQFHQQMGGKAEIVTDEQLFILRLFDKFLSFGG